MYCTRGMYNSVSNYKYKAIIYKGKKKMVKIYSIKINV